MQASIVFCTYKLGYEKIVPAEKLEYNRWSYTDLVEKCLQEFEVWHFVPVSGAHHSQRLMSPGSMSLYLVFIFLLDTERGILYWRGKLWHTLPRNVMHVTKPCDTHGAACFGLISSTLYILQKKLV